MQIVCPNCAKAYELDAAKLGPAGRKVRCASCQTQWHVEPVFPEPPSPDETQALLDAELQRGLEDEVTAIAAEAEAGAQAEEAPASAEAEAPEPDLPAPPPKPRRGRTKSRKVRHHALADRAIAVPAALGVVGFAVLGLLLWQPEASVRLVPQLAGLYEAIGKPVNIRGLSLTAIDSGLVEDAQGRFLVVEGDVTNITRSDKPVPLIEIAVQDGAGQTLYTWTTEPPRQKLEPAEQMRFRARLAAPPDTGRAVSVRFRTTAPVKQADAKAAQSRH